MPITGIETLTYVFRIAAGALLVFAGLTKIANLKGFFVTVVQYGILTGKLARIFAYSLPFAETLSGILLISAWNIKYGSIIALLVMFSSTFGVLFALLKQKKMDDCGCFGGTIKVPLSWKKFAENMVWMILIAVITLHAWEII